MENSANDPQTKKEEENKRGLTPHELVQRHMNNPDEPITDEDMNNLELSIDTTAPEQQNDSNSLSTEELESLKKRAINPLDVLGK